MPVVTGRSQRPDLLQINRGIVSHGENETFTKNSTLKSTRSSSRSGQAVHFCEVVNVRAIPHIDDMEEEQVNEIWYHKREFVAIKQNFLPTLRALAHGTYKGDSEHECARGLEYRQKKRAQERKMNRLNTLCAVLDEQNRQRMEGIYDDELLCSVYMDNSTYCQKVALIMGIKDAQEAMSPYNQNPLYRK